jgi:hypothetical protein
MGGCASKEPDDELPDDELPDDELPDVLPAVLVANTHASDPFPPIEESAMTTLRLAVHSRLSPDTGMCSLAACDYLRCQWLGSPNHVDWFLVEGLPWVMKMLVRVHCERAHGACCAHVKRTPVPASTSDHLLDL